MANNRSQLSALSSLRLGEHTGREERSWLCASAMWCVVA
jgi:hypothetical protein